MCCTKAEKQARREDVSASRPASPPPPHPISSLHAELITCRKHSPSSAGRPALTSTLPLLTKPQARGFSLCPSDSQACPVSWTHHPPAHPIIPIPAHASLLPLSCPASGQPAGPLHHITILFPFQHFPPSNPIWFIHVLTCLLSKQQPTPIFLPGEYHGQRSLAGCSP